MLPAAAVLLIPTQTVAKQLQGSRFRNAQKCNPCSYLALIFANPRETAAGSSLFAPQPPSGASKWRPRPSLAEPREEEEEEQQQAGRLTGRQAGRLAGRQAGR